MFDNFNEFNPISLDNKELQVYASDETVTTTYAKIESFT